METPSNSQFHTIRDYKWLPLIGLLGIHHLRGFGPAVLKCSNETHLKMVGFQPEWPVQAPRSTGPNKGVQGRLRSRNVEAQENGIIDLSLAPLLQASVPDTVMRHHGIVDPDYARAARIVIQFEDVDWEWLNFTCDSLQLASLNPQFMLPDRSSNHAISVTAQSPTTTQNIATSQSLWKYEAPVTRSSRFQWSDSTKTILLHITQQPKSSIKSFNMWMTQKSEMAKSYHSTWGFQLVP